MRSRLYSEWLLIAVLLPFVLWFLQQSPGLMQIDLALYDQAIGRTQPPPSPDILVVGIDERSLKALGPWPWPRSVHAQFLERLALAEPRAVLLDFFLDTPSADPQEDRSLAQAMVHLPVYLPLRYVDPFDRAPDEVPGFVEPLPEFARNAKAVGHVNITRDADGIARRMYLREGMPGRLQDYVGWRLSGDDLIHGDGLAVPRQRGGGWQTQGEFGIPLTGPAGTRPMVPYLSVLRGEVPAELLRNKLVLVGALASSRLEIEPTVVGAGFGSSMPSIELHANAIDALRNQRAVCFVGGAWLAVWGTVPVWMALVFFRRSPRGAWAATLALSSLCFTLSIGMLALAHCWLSPLAPILGVVLTYLLWSWRRFEAMFDFFRRRILALNAASDVFESKHRAPVRMWDEVETQVRALDNAIDRVVQVHTLLSMGLWQMPVALLVCRADGSIATSNAAARALLNVRSADSITMLDDPLRGRVLQELFSGFKTDSGDSPSGRSNPELHRLDGLDCECTTTAGKVIRVHAAALNHEDRDPINWMVVMHDLTAEREREQWLGFMSHDMRTPQVNILSLLDPGIDMGGKGDQPCVKEAVRREAERSLRLADNFVDLLKARLQSYYSFAAISVGAIAMDAIDQVWAQAAQRGIALSAELPVEGEVELWADSPLLTRAIVNLLSNAIRYSASGASVRLCIALSGELAPERVLIAVRDEGRGMTPSAMDALLRFNAGGVTAATGTPFAEGPARSHGIGLAFVRAVVDRHGGHLDGYSAPGVGTTFVIDLPRYREFDRN